MIDRLNMMEARKAAILTQKELADMVGVSVVTICRYETGKRTPNVRIAKRIGKILGVPWFEIIDNKKAG